MKANIIARNKEHLQRLIIKEMKDDTNSCDLNHIDVSLVTDMNSLFAYSDFNGSISNWNTSNVEDMAFMFASSNFNRDISKWNVNKVNNMMSMFNRAQFNGDISQWNVCNVTNMTGMFQYSQFNGDISKWKPLNLNNCRHILNTLSKAKPYWYSESATEVVQKIKATDLAQNMEQQLPLKNSFRKIKI